MQLSYDLFGPARVVPKATEMRSIVAAFYRRWVEVISSKKGIDAAAAAVNADHFKRSLADDLGFRTVLIAGLRNSTPIGNISFSKPQDRLVQLQYNLPCGSLSQTTIADSPDLKEAERKPVPITVADYLAWCLSSHIDNIFGKLYVLTWPTAKREAAREKVIKWLQTDRESWKFYLQ